jgi:hypothetical protein
MEKITIGRAPECDLNIPESFPSVSNEHADLHLIDGSLTFFDHSSNGTMINGKKVHKTSVSIKRGDKIVLGGSYELKWPEIERFFPSLHRATVRFDGSQIDTDGRKTELFDSRADNINDRKTELIDNNSNDNKVRKTETLVSSTNGEQIRGQLNSVTQAEIEDQLEKWNWGAFLSSWMWSIANRIYWPLIIIPISFIPYIGQVASLFLCTFLGINGYRLSWSKASDHNFTSFSNKQKKWIPIGIFLFTFFSIIQAISLYIIL